MQQIITQHLLIVPRDHKHVDVFRGTGWMQHSLFEHGLRYLRLKKGEFLTAEEYKELTDVKNQHFYGGGDAGARNQ